MGWGVTKPERFSGVVGIVWYRLSSCSALGFALGAVGAATTRSEPGCQPSKYSPDFATKSGTANIPISASKPATIFSSGNSVLPLLISGVNMDAASLW